MSADLAQKIIKQIEYYFGDVNMSKDKFLQEEIMKDSGWVSLNVLTTFNRLKSLSTDSDFIIKSLEQSTAGLLEIDEENKRIRRVKPLPENKSDFETTLKQNTLYVKGFPTNLSLDDLLAFFEPYGKILQIYMKKLLGTKKFKGSLFVTFENKEEMTKFCETEGLKYNDQALIVESQEAYLKRKTSETEQIKKLKEEKLAKKANEESEALKNMKKGSVIHLTGFNQECSREDIKEIFDNHSKIDWIHYNRGDTEAHLRLSEENTAKTILDTVLNEKNGKIELKGATLECKVLEGDEEVKFWIEVAKTEKNKQNKKKFKRKSGGSRNQNNKKFKKNGRNNDENGDKDDQNGDNNDDDEDDGNDDD